MTCNPARLFAPRGRRGIALVIVLGMLALLVMMGVAFSIFMRTERQAAGSFVHDVRARQLLAAARSRALEAIQRDMAGKPYPDWVALVSPGSNTIALSTNDLWAPYVPDNLLLDPLFPKNAGWITVNNGRIAYVIVNASGLLDATYAGGGNRQAGRGPEEIDVAGLSDVTDPAKLKQFRPYESVAQMKKAKAAIGINAVANLTDYSMCSTNYTPQMADLSGNDMQLAAKSGAIKPLLNDPAYFPGINSDVVFDLLLDYVDEDNVPRSLTQPSVERVPMINEVRIRPLMAASAADVTAGNVRLLFQGNIELFYPFVTIKNDNYTLEFSYTVSSPTPGAPVPAGPLTGSVIINNFPGTIFTTWPMNVNTPITIPVAALAGQTLTYNIMINYIRIRNAQGTVDQVLDLTLANATSFIQVTVPAAPVAMNWMGPGYIGRACADPRYNHVSTFWVYYSQDAGFAATPSVATNGTMGTTNGVTRALCRAAGSDGHIWMHTADQPILSPGELSYLPRVPAGNPAMNTAAWRTFRLVDEGALKADPLFNCFTATNPAAARRGFINPNTDVQEVLAAGMRNMVLERYPGDPQYANEMTISAARANTLSSEWMADSNSASYLSRGSMVSNILYIRAVSNMVNSVFSIIPPASPSEERLQAVHFRREAAFRNLLGLMNPWQNYFIVILFAQSSTLVQGAMRSDGTMPPPVPTVRADQSAVCEVWRDPLPKVQSVAGVTTTNYPTFIRRYDILSQE